MRRPVDITIEIAVGLAIVAGIFLSAEYFPDRDLPTKWLGLAASAAILFGYPLYWTRSVTKSARFWFYWYGFLILHLIILAGRNWPLAARMVRLYNNGRVPAYLSSFHQNPPASYGSIRETLNHL